MTSYLPWLAGGAALGYAARRGRRAAVTDTRNLGVWIDRQAEEWGRLKLLLYRPSVLRSMWESKPEPRWGDPFFSGELSGWLVHGNMPDGSPLVYGYASLKFDRDFCGGWELSEVAAVPGYGPLTLDLAIALVGAKEGVFPDQTSLSPQAREMFAASEETGKYTLLRNKEAICRRYKDPILDSRYVLKPKLRSSMTKKLKELEGTSDARIAAVPTDRANVDKWLGYATKDFFDSRYFGTERGTE